MTWRMKNAGVSFVVLSMCLLFTALISGCGSGGNEPKFNGELNACDLLAGINPEALFGEPVHKPKERIHQKDAGSTVSRCIYSAKNDWKKTMSLQVRYIPNSANPKTAQAFLKSQEFGNLKLESKEIRGLGDVAVSLSNAYSLQLRVFWKKHFRMNVVLTEFGDNAQALEKAKSVARHVMKSL